MLFAIRCTDRPGSLAVRRATREAHLAHVAALGAAVVEGGPLLDEAGAPQGSLLLVDMPDLNAARRFAAADPYGLAGLFETVSIQPYRSVFRSGERVG